MMPSAKTLSWSSAPPEKTLTRLRRFWSLPASPMQYLALARLTPGAQDRPEPEQGHNAKGKEQLRPEVWRSERLSERAEHSISCGLGGGFGLAGSKAERRGTAPGPDYPAELVTWALRWACNVAEVRVFSRLVPVPLPGVIQGTSLPMRRSRPAV